MSVSRGLRLALTAWLLLAAGCSRAAPPEFGAPQAWVEVTATGFELRATAKSGTCPSAQIDGRPTEMAVRSTQSETFPAICALAAPKGSTAVSALGHVWKLGDGAPKRIVVIGDTGCRVRDLSAQDCRSATGWPFARVAQLAAAKAPDLVIHAGDYYYRESPCPFERADCRNSPYGDRFDTWRAELFDPAAALLAAAPVVFVRGNHESCKRGGDGWARLLETRPWAGACQEGGSSFVARLGDLSLGVLDSSVADDRDPKPRGVEVMAAQLDKVRAGLGPGESFLLTHRPIWAAVPVARMGPLPPIFVGLNATEQAAAKGRTPDQVSLVISGHVHHFAAYTFGPTRPAQLVAGEGGATLADSDRPALDRTPLKIDGMEATKVNFARYGYALMEKTETGWTIEAHDLDDKVVLRCRLKGRDLACDPG